MSRMPRVTSHPSGYVEYGEGHWDADEREAFVEVYRRLAISRDNHQLLHKQMEFAFEAGINEGRRQMMVERPVEKWSYSTEKE